MADEEREKKIVDEKKARAEAVDLLCTKILGYIRRNRIADGYKNQ